VTVNTLGFLDGAAHTPAGSTVASPKRDSRTGGSGVSFPLHDGKRSTTATGRAILADAAAATDPALAARIRRCGDWRSSYAGCIRDLTVASTRGGDDARAIARAGLDSMRSRLVLERGGSEPRLQDALGELEPARELGTGEIHGAQTPVTALRVPYRGRLLEGAELIAQLERWVAAGSVEPSFASSLREVVEHPEWLALSGRKVALLGAGAEIGPLEPLCSWGADVIALDVPVPAIAKRIAAVAERGAGTVQVPVAADGAQGLDLLAELPEARAWLARSAGDAELVLGMYAYADGGRHVRLSGAFDALATDLLSREPASALAYLATPTDAFIVPPETVAAARAAYAARGVRRALQAPAKALSGGRLFRAAYADGVPVADALVTQQGPNYALAKRAQRWRGVLSDAEGHRVSFNVAPATLTRSVVKNRVLAAAYAGAHRFGIEIFAPSTTRVLMAALLVHDLHRPRSGRGDAESLFSDGAAHGGLWRAAYQPGSVLGIAALAGLPASLIGRGGRGGGETAAAQSESFDKR
jgi:hypothetical protein